MPLLTKPRLAAFIAAAFTCVAANAQLHIPVPGENWYVEVPLPALPDTTESFNAKAAASHRKKVVYMGNAGNLIVSLTLDSPICEGMKDTIEDAYRCYAGILRHKPTVVWDTERASTVPAGALVSYMSDFKSVGEPVQALSVDLVFSHHGHWATLHAMKISPDPQDAPALFAVVSAAKIEDGATAPASAASAASAALEASPASAASTAARTGRRTVDVPDAGWSIALDAPPLTAKPSPDPRVHPLFGGSAGRLNVSMYAESPRCAGEDTADSVLKCYLTTLDANPTVVRESMKTERLDGDYMVLRWDARIPYQGRVYQQSNANVLFTHKGKWVDVHLSYIEPTDDDKEQLVRMAKSVKALDGAR